MAGTATATYPADVWTSASSVDAGQHQWEFSVPVNTDNNRQRSKSRTSRDAKSRDRGSKGSRSSSISKHTHAQEQSHYSSRGRREASLSRKENEGGGVQDAATTPHINGTTKKSDKKEGVGYELDELNDEKWIHRDKLAKIESEELQQAAILFQRRPGAGSIKATRGRSREQRKGSVSGTAAITPPTAEPLEPWPDLQVDQRNHPSSSDPDGEDVADEERRNWDLRRPEEIAASNIYRNPGGRKSSSRIPVPSQSPAPLSPERIDREFSVNRSRAPTNEEEESQSTSLPRRTSEPLTVDSASSSSPPRDSRPGSRGVSSRNAGAKKTPAKTGPTNRKTTSPSKKSTTARSRATSSNNNQRPTTRGENRPTPTINRPEGDPPWLATMYKPDPRLPPDQQILPTHARRMQQEQWAKEGKTPTTYDREFAPLIVAPEPPRQENKVETDKPEEPPQPEPAKTMEGSSASQYVPKSPESGARPGTSSGYSAMPRVHDTPPTGFAPRFPTQTVVTAQPPQEDDKVDKGCGCCIVM
ncbi:hypothetical protein BJX61DRAFT_537459 [Aspergillus egyptiacus]|nr:hypothetical protein BJX61DRAFT_537459 [Aspergillus egyptiacus]